MKYLVFVVLTLLFSIGNLQNVIAHNVEEEIIDKVQEKHAIGGFMYAIGGEATDSASIELEKKKQEQTNKIEELKKKVADTQKTAKTLEGQISYIKAQINLAEVNIGITEELIEKTRKQINDLGGKIENLDSAFEKQLVELEANMTAQYRYPKTDLLSFFVSQVHTEELLSSTAYYEFLRDAQKKSLITIQQAKLNAEEQKKLREQKEEELKDQEQDLQNQKQNLAYQQKQKDSLLQETKNDEVIYQQLLQQAQAEFNAINNAAASAVKNGPVKKGDVIAMTGNSGYPGCSSAKHLHFEVRKNGTWVDPKAYVKSNPIQDLQRGINTNYGNGNWDWPLIGGIYLTQDFGKTPWSWRYAYSGGIHTGLDMVGIISDVIYAPSDGILYSTTEACGSSSRINIKYIDHGNGIMSYFLHVR